MCEWLSSSASVEPATFLPCMCALRALVCVRVCAIYAVYLNRRLFSITVLAICLLYHQKFWPCELARTVLPENVQAADPAPASACSMPHNRPIGIGSISDNNLFASNGSFMFGNWTLGGNDMRRNGRENERVKCTHHRTLACERTHTHAHKLKGKWTAFWPLMKTRFPQIEFT